MTLFWLVMLIISCAVFGTGLAAPISLAGFGLVVLGGMASVISLTLLLNNIFD